MRKKILCVFGTRPEAIKMCPLVLELKNDPRFECLVCVTGQHREMLDQVLSLFNITPDYDLNVMVQRQSLTTLSANLLTALEKVLISTKAEVVLVHGDTTTSSMAALAAFYQQIPVGHVEAGLRTYDKYNPFPEEINRQITSRIADIHFAPTAANVKNLLNEGVSTNVHITGNTVIDAFKTTVTPNYVFKNPALAAIDFSAHRVMVLTAHRRENLGQPIENICKAILAIAKTFSDTLTVYPMHMNPALREQIVPLLENQPNILLIDPLDVADMHNLMNRCHLVVTDSGGLQEEAPSLGKPVVVLRRETERQEAIEAGTVCLAGTNEKDIVDTITRLLTLPSAYYQMARAINPYGDGHASKRIADALAQWNK